LSLKVEGLEARELVLTECRLSSNVGDARVRSTSPLCRHPSWLSSCFYLSADESQYGWRLNVDSGKSCLKVQQLREVTAKMCDCSLIASHGLRTHPDCNDAERFACCAGDDQG